MYLKFRQIPETTDRLDLYTCTKGSWKGGVIKKSCCPLATNVFVLPACLHGVPLCFDPGGRKCSYKNLFLKVDFMFYLQGIAKYA